MPEDKKGRQSRVYSTPKTELPKRGQRTATHKERTSAQPKTTKGKMGK